MNDLFRFSKIKIVLKEGSTISSYAHGSLGLTDCYVFLQFDKDCYAFLEFDKPSSNFQHSIIPREMILHIGYDAE